MYLCFAVCFTELAQERTQVTHPGNQEDLFVDDMLEWCTYELEQPIYTLKPNRERLDQFSTDYNIMLERLFPYVIPLSLVDLTLMLNTFKLSCTRMDRLKKALRDFTYQKASDHQIALLQFCCEALGDKQTLEGLTKESLGQAKQFIEAKTEAYEHEVQLLSECANDLKINPTYLTVQQLTDWYKNGENKMVDWYCGRDMRWYRCAAMD